MLKFKSINFSFLFVSLLFFGFCFKAQAVENYLVNYQDVFLVSVDTSDNDEIYFLADQRNRKKQPLPLKWKQISKAHYFKTKINLGVKQVSLKYNETKARDGYERQIAYWNREKGKWIRLKTEDDGSYLTANLKKKRAKVIALERKELRVKTFVESDFDVSVPRAIVIDKDSGAVIYGKNISEQRSMASLTKIMTAIVFLESETSFDKEVIMSSQDFVYGNYVGLKTGDVVTAGDLFYSTLVASSNVSAYALARSTGMTMDEFVGEMNKKAQELGLEKTEFAEPSGLDENNKTTVYEYAMFTREIFNSLEMLKGTTTKEYIFKTKAGRWLKARSTNNLVRYGSDLYLTGGKTGFTYEAGYCLMLKAKDNNHEVVTVIMGGESSSQRFNDAEKLTKWVLNNAFN